MLDLTKFLFGLNLVDFIFINFFIVMLVSAILMLSKEDSLPRALRQSLRYGKHCYKGTNDALVSLLEIPKSWFKHFYLFAGAYSSIAALLVCYVYGIGGRPPIFVENFLDFVYGPQRVAKGKRVQQSWHI